MGPMGAVSVDRGDGQVWVVTVTGEHDISNGAEIAAALDAGIAAGASIVVDLSRAEFIDSTVLGSLILAAAQVDRDGATFAIAVSPGSLVDKLCTIAGVTLELGVCGSLDVALTGLERASV